MSTKPPEKRSSTHSRIRSSLEDLRSQLVDLEAFTSCARKAAEQLPYVPRPARPGHHAGPVTDADLADAVEARRNYGRLQSLVFAAAQAAEQVVESCEDALDRADADDNSGNDDGGNDGGNDNGGGPAGNDQSSGPGALTRGHGGTPSLLTIQPQPFTAPIPPLA